MAIIKCRMCGGNIIPSENGFGVCDSCGLQQLLSEQGVNYAQESGFQRFIPSNVASVHDNDEKIEPLIKRVFLFIEDGKWKNADEYCEKILDIDPEYGPVYLGKLMIEYRVTKPEYLANLTDDFGKSGNYQKAVRYGNEALKNELAGYCSQAKVNVSEHAVQESFSAAVAGMNSAKTKDAFIDLASRFRQLGDYKNSAELAEICTQKAEEKRCEEIYSRALKAEAKGDADSLNEAINGFSQITDYKDSYKRTEKCREKLKLASVKGKTKNIVIYAALAVSVIAKFICSANWASRLDIKAEAGGAGIMAWLTALLHVIGLMALEVVITSAVSIFASKCRLRKIRLGGLIMLVITFFESLMMASISSPQMTGEKFSKIFLFYLIFSVVCNFTLYILMLICTKIKKSITKD